MLHQPAAAITKQPSRACFAGDPIWKVHLFSAAWGTALQVMQGPVFYNSTAQAKQSKFGSVLGQLAEPIR